MDSVLKKVESMILNSKDHNQIWSYEDFSEFAYNTVTKALSVLAKNNIIKRIEKGLYYVPKKTILGLAPPHDMSIIIKKVSKKANFYCVSGLNGYNKIGLTTQVPNTITIACDYPFRSNEDVNFLLRNKPHSGTELERIILDALIDIEKIPDTAPHKTIKKIKRFIQDGRINIDDLGYSALKESPRVKAIIGALGEELNMDKQLLKKIKNSLNPGTSYLLNIKDALKYSKEWNIRQKK